MQSINICMLHGLYSTCPKYHKGPVMGSLDVAFDTSLNKLLKTVTGEFWYHEAHVTLL